MSRVRVMYPDILSTASSRVSARGTRASAAQWQARQDGRHCGIAGRFTPLGSAPGGQWHLGRYDARLLQRLRRHAGTACPLLKPSVAPRQQRVLGRRGGHAVCIPSQIVTQSWPFEFANSRPCTRSALPLPRRCRVGAIKSATHMFGGVAYDCECWTVDLAVRLW